MVSIYEQALGKNFERLHPRIQERFGFASADHIASVGTGTMEWIWYNRWVTPLLCVGASRHIMFPQGGSDVPFTIENYAYIDQFGRETVSWIRRFDFGPLTRHFDATMIYSEQRRGIVDYLGNKQHLAVDLRVHAASNGGIQFTSGEQRFYEGMLGFRFPKLFTATANVNEWFDEELQKFRIAVEVRNPVIGTIFNYRGSFEVSMLRTEPNGVPNHIKPLREEMRE
ncbi:conserved hypothetical protein [Paenibacillus curdlanolyticus YK9]|uniref:DUF4166 domain-containing protein n=1 Tax=Paenibacillus curdlanolyticus YK9 TaxID=717606 RepID=E0I654_9BACL|nr:DUF4166 domain-containing protein [Paenibacillus curdlanolyticus]EFM12446.1 conserved hypothetical protein [Paenibacillus curdlanolyticus YK9]